MEATASARSRLPQLTKYEVVEEIGHGGMATVYRAKDKRLGREVSIALGHLRALVPENLLQLE